MKDEPSYTALMVNRVIADLDNGFVHRTKPLRLTFQKLIGSGGWVPVFVCEFCGYGPITSLDNDSCCGTNEQTCNGYSGRVPEDCKTCGKPMVKHTNNFPWFKSE